MAMTWRPQDDELIEYILAALDEEFSPLVSSLITRTEPVSLEELFSQLLAFETHLELLYGGHHNHGGSANYSGVVAVDHTAGARPLVDVDGG
jgi:hypothetical protein